MHHLSFLLFMSYNELVIILFFPPWSIVASSSLSSGDWIFLRFRFLKNVINTLHTFSLITKYITSITDTRLKPIHKPRRPPTLATNLVTVTFSSLMILFANESFNLGIRQLMIWLSTQKINIKNLFHYFNRNVAEKLFTLT